MRRADRLSIWLYDEAREWASDRVASALEVKFIEEDIADE